MRPRRCGLLLAVGAMSAVLAVVPAALGESAGTSAAASDTTTTVMFEPAADARVEEANPSTNYGIETRLKTDGDAGLTVESYLRFDVAGVVGAVRSAKLRLY